MLLNSLQTRAVGCCEQSGAGWRCDQLPATTPSGWRLSDESSIELVGDACTNFRIGDDEALAATFPCAVFRPQ
jgi:hypothetical protein